MGNLVLVEEEVIHASPEAVFGLFGRSADAGWLFGSSCDAVARGSVVRFALPVGTQDGAPLEAAGRIVALEPPHRIQIRHEFPWRGTVTCTIRGDEAGSTVRVVVELPQEAMGWWMRRRGKDPPVEAGAGTCPVGLLTSQSGTAGVYAGASEDLARLAVDELNADGLRGDRLSLAVADDATYPAVGVRELRRLITSEGCRVVVTNVTSATFNAIEPVAAQAGVLLIHSPVNEGGRTSDVLFRLGERPAGVVREAVPRLMAETGHRRWFLVGDDYSWPRATNAWVSRAIERAGGVVVGDRYAPLGSRDFGPLLEAIDRSGADLIASAFVGGDEVAFERQCFEAGVRRRARTLSLCLDESTRDHIGDAAVAGLWSVWGYFQELDTRLNGPFLRRYHERAGDGAPPVSSLSQSVYETIHLVGDAMRRARSTEPVEIGRALRSASFAGPRGTVSVVGPGHHHQPLYLAEAVPGGFRILDAVG